MYVKDELRIISCLLCSITNESDKEVKCFYSEVAVATTTADYSV